MRDEYRWRRVVYGIGMGWRTAAAVSPLVFGKDRKGTGAWRLAKLARYTQIDARTLKKTLDPLVQVGMLVRRGDDGYAVNPRLPLKQFVRMTKAGYPSYFKVGVRGPDCPLSPSENHLYWWVRSQVEQGRKRLGPKRAVRLTGMPRSTLRLALRGLFSKGFLAAGGDGELVLPEIDLAAMFPGRGIPKGGRPEGTLADLAARPARPPSARPRKPERRSRRLEVQFEPLPDDPLYSCCSATPAAPPGPKPVPALWAEAMSALRQEFDRQRARDPEGWVAERIADQFLCGGE